MKIRNNFAEKLARIEHVTNREKSRAETVVNTLKGWADEVENMETGKSERAICKQFARLYKRAAALIEKAITDETDETDETENA